MGSFTVISINLQSGNNTNEEIWLKVYTFDWTCKPCAISLILMFKTKREMRIKKMLSSQRDLSLWFFFL